MCTTRPKTTLNFFGISASKTRIGQDVDCLDQQQRVACTDQLRDVRKSLASRDVVQVDQATLAHREIRGQRSERGKDANLLRGVYLPAHRNRQETISSGSTQSVRNPTNLEPNDVLNTPINQLLTLNPSDSNGQSEQLQLDLL